MQQQVNKQKGYGKHSKTFWIGVYLVGAAILYGLAYLVFFHHGSSGIGHGY